MDKDRASIEIENILWGKEHENKTLKEHRGLIKEVLQKLQTYNYNLGRRHGMFKAVNILTELAKEEGRVIEELKTE